MRTLKELAKEAVEVQDALNLSGVIHAFSRAITELRENLSAAGSVSTDDINHHPICILWSSKIASLTDSEGDGKFSWAYNWCCNKKNES